MSAKRVDLEVLSPRGERPRVSNFDARGSLGSLRGKKIGILNNTKSGGDLLLPYVLASLKRRIPDVNFREWRVPFPLAPEQKAPRLREIAEYSDGVIALMGD